MPFLTRITVHSTVLRILILCIAFLPPGCPDKSPNTVALREIDIEYKCTGDPDPLWGSSGSIRLSSDGLLMADRRGRARVADDHLPAGYVSGQLDARVMTRIKDLEKKANLSKLERSYAEEPTNLKLPFASYRIDDFDRATIVEDRGAGPQELRQYVAGVASIAALWFADDQSQIEAALRALGTHETFLEKPISADDIESIEMRDQSQGARSIYRIDADAKLRVTTGFAKAQENAEAVLDAQSKQLLFESVVTSRFFDLAPGYGSPYRGARTIRLTVRLSDREHTVSFDGAGPNRLFELLERIRATVKPAVRRSEK